MHTLYVPHGYGMKQFKCLCCHLEGFMRNFLLTTRGRWRKEIGCSALERGQRERVGCEERKIESY